MSVSLSNLATLVTMLVAMAGLYVGLKRELRSELRRELGSELAPIRVDIAQLKSDILRLDDRLYALATGLRPVIEQAERAP